MKSTHFLLSPYDNWLISHMKSKTKTDEFIGFYNRKIFGNWKNSGEGEVGLDLEVFGRVLSGFAEL